MRLALAKSQEEAGKVERVDRAAELRKVFVAFDIDGEPRCQDSTPYAGEGWYGCFGCACEPFLIVYVRMVVWFVSYMYV